MHVHSHFTCVVIILFSGLHEMTSVIQNLCGNLWQWCGAGIFQAGYPL